VLERYVENRARLAALEETLQRALLVAAGRFSRPERDEIVRYGKELRKRTRIKEKRADREQLETVGLRLQRRSPVYQPHWLPLPSAADAEQREPDPELHQARTCYVCKEPYTELHAYYDSMCRSCGDFNYQKRLQTADLRGRTALITGSRVKIGFQAGLLLLRAGAKLIVTTRFPVDAAARYAAEPDYASFADRLQIHGLDLRHAPSVELFARYLCSTEPRLDYLLNNACQTVRRPAGFYAHLLEREESPLGALPEAWRVPLSAHRELCASLGSGATAGGASLALLDAAPGIGLREAARLSQRRYLDEDFRDDEALFPRGRYDEDLQQVDLRALNSWRLDLAQVATAELLEVQLVNAVAPFILNSKLKALMLKTRSFDQHIVNVSAMEGQFYRTTKTDKHPHTNMAKAALNMLTRTSAADYVKDGIHMNAIDTGWITDEDPAAHAARKAELGFAPPLDVLDGAARIVDPIFHGANTGEHVWGQFLKDYKPARW
jgi:NAD(P)-dependent dehydrogenase (short-subunit alcohol dehydrogenase family)